LMRGKLFKQDFAALGEALQGARNELSALTKGGE